MALLYAGQSDNQSMYGDMVNVWLNEALVDIYQEHGIEDSITGLCVPGVRTVPLPLGFIAEKMVMVNRMPLDYKTDPNKLDFFSQSNSLPQWYTIWNKPSSAIQLGPMPPDSAYPLEVWFFRSPLEMTDDSHFPELPPRWRTAIAKKAATEILITDGLFLHKDKYEGLIRQYERMRTEFLAYFTAESRNNYDTPRLDRPY